MYSTIISKIETILNGIDKIAEVHSNPTSEFNGYPAAVFFPVRVGNEFETNSENIKEYDFKLYLISSAANSNLNELYNDVMPNLVDSVLSAFDSGWDLNSIDGHRVWLKVESGDWETSTEEQGLIAYGEFNIIIKTLTNN